MFVVLYNSFNYYKLPRKTNERVKPESKDNAVKRRLQRADGPTAARRRSHRSVFALPAHSTTAFTYESSRHLSTAIIYSAINVFTVSLPIPR